LTSSTPHRGAHIVRRKMAVTILFHNFKQLLLCCWCVFISPNQFWPTLLEPALSSSLHPSYSGRS
jgi:hypothetical protein